VLGEGTGWLCHLPYGLCDPFEVTELDMCGGVSRGRERGGLLDPAGSMGNGGGLFHVVWLGDVMREYLGRWSCLLSESSRAGPRARLSLKAGADLEGGEEPTSERCWKKPWGRPHFPRSGGGLLCESVGGVPELRVDNG
jgi:hypothetical protein